MVAFQTLRQSEQAKRLIAMINHILCITPGNTDCLGAYCVVSRNAVVQKYSQDIPTRAMAFSTYAYFNALGGTAWKGRRFRKLTEQYIGDASTEWWQAVTVQNIGAYHFFEGDFEVARTYLEQSLDFFRRSRDWQYSLTLHWLRHVHSAVGDSETIIQHASMEREAGTQTGDGMVEAWVNMA